MNFETFLKQFDQWQSKPHMFIVNKKRMKTIENAYDILEEMIHKYTPDAHVEINMSVVDDGSASLSVETDEIVAHNVQDFIDIIKDANNFEIYPLNNGNIKISIMFNGIMTLIK
jgi:viroplasmin and RNaseH domain-containing protein